MDTRYISLCLVRLALKRPIYPDMLCAAVTSRYAPALDHDLTLIHGRIVTYDLRRVI